MAAFMVRNGEANALDWKAAILAGVIAGIVFMVMEMI